MDKDVIATLNVISCLLTELQTSGHLDVGALVEKIQKGAAEHRRRGDPHGLADPLHRVTEYLLTTVPLPPKSD